MATELNKPVSRRASAASVREAGQLRDLVVTLYPDGTIGLRPSKLRKEERLPLTAVYHSAVKARVLSERREKFAAKKARRFRGNN